MQMTNKTIVSIFTFILFGTLMGCAQISSQNNEILLQGGYVLSMDSVVKVVSLNFMMVVIISLQQARSLFLSTPGGSNKLKF